MTHFLAESQTHVSVHHSHRATAELAEVPDIRLHGNHNRVMVSREFIVSLSDCPCVIPGPRAGVRGEVVTRVGREPRGETAIWFDPATGEVYADSPAELHGDKVPAWLAELARDGLAALEAHEAA